MRREITVERLERIAATALLGGYGRVLAHGEHVRDAHGRPVARHDRAWLPRRLVELRCSMDCSDPRTVELFSRDSSQHGKKVKPLTVIVYSRCRKCTNCRERRRMFWSARALAEFNSAVRSLFGTLTVAPENDVMIDAIARIEQAEIGTDFDRLSDADKFRIRCAIGGREITKWIKRLRSTGAEFRYLLVAEQHNGVNTSDLKKGRPHWHCLLHEVNASALLVQADEWSRRENGEVRTDKYGNSLVDDKSFLKGQWKLGHSSFALCRTPLAAGYICKYLTKEDMSIRIRASGRYGNPVSQKDAGVAIAADDGAQRKEAPLDPPPKDGNSLLVA